MADLTILSSSLLKYAMNDNGNIEPETPNVTYEEVWQMIQSHENFMKIINNMKQRVKLKVIKGGLL